MNHESSVNGVREESPPSLGSLLSVEPLLYAAVLECFSIEDLRRVSLYRLIADARIKAAWDLDAFAAKDPAAGGKPEYIAKAYTSFAAVLHYRLASSVRRNRWLARQGVDVESTAGVITRRGKLLSGAEIHSRCQIGKRFVLDHGFGTVIGETAQIGDDCYFLGGVTLGARGVSSNPEGKRHPTIGNRVQIGANASIFGPVNIGDDVFIGPGCIVSADIPNDSQVKIKVSLQIIRRIKETHHECHASN